MTAIATTLLELTGIIMLLASAFAILVPISLALALAVTGLLAIMCSGAIEAMRR